MEKGQYSSWAKLFKIHYRAYKVIDYIIQPKLSDKGKEQVAEVDPELWSPLDAIVLQWIYGTISNDLLITILEPDKTTHQVWERLKNIFQDNKHSRAVYLENQFSNISACCQKLKMLADQLSNIGAPVSNQKLVLQLIAGLNENYDGAATFIQHSDPLPLFYEAHSRLILEETRKAKQTATASNTAGIALLTAGNLNDNSISGGSSDYGSSNQNNHSNNRQKRGQSQNNNKRKSNK